VKDLYVDALSQLNIRLTIETTGSSAITGSVEATGEVGVKLLARVSGKGSTQAQTTDGEKSAPVGRNIDDLRFVADIVKASGRRLVIEDFHYLSVDERKEFAFDLKTMWDYGLFLIIIGVWSQTNMLLYLNPDLSGRVEEIPIYWSDDDLTAVIARGSQALNIEMSSGICKKVTGDCFGNVGILQKLVLSTLDNAGVHEQQSTLGIITDSSALETAAMEYAEQLNPLYMQFATRISAGIRKRKDSTGIYAHAMAVILNASDEVLMNGLPLDEIFVAANQRQARIQKGNLRKVLEKFEELQVDDEGRGLVLSYNDPRSEITVVDRQLLLYRRYATVKWPWDELIAEADRSGGGYEDPEVAVTASSAC
jgi:hypothetical protein